MPNNFDAQIASDSEEFSTRKIKYDITEKDLTEDIIPCVAKNVKRHLPLDYFKDIDPTTRALLKSQQPDIEHSENLQSTRQFKVSNVERMAERARLENIKAENARRNKIRSKSYRKYKKHHNERMALKQASLTKENKADLLIADQEKLEKERIEERMTQKSRSGGKYAKLRNMAKTNPHARERFNEVNERANKLLTKKKEDSESEELSEADSDSNVERVAVDVDTDNLEDLNINGESIDHFLNRTENRDSTKISNDDAQLLADAIDESEEEQDLDSTHNAIFHEIMDDDQVKIETETDINDKKTTANSSKVGFVHNVWYSDLAKDEQNKQTKSRKRKRAKVYVNTSLPPCTKKHFVTKVPYPYNTKEQFDLAMKKPVMAAFSSHKIVHDQKKYPAPSNKVDKPKKFKSDMYF